MLSLYSIEGKKVLSKTINIGTPGRVQKRIDLGDFETGIYIVKIEGPGISDASRLCVVK